MKSLYQEYHVQAWILTDSWYILNEVNFDSKFGMWAWGRYRILRSYKRAILSNSCSQPWKPPKKRVKSLANTQPAKVLTQMQHQHTAEKLSLQWRAPCAWWDNIPEFVLPMPTATQHQ